MILEAIVTTTNDDGSPNVAPMGPSIESDPADGFELRPFETSRTFANLQQRPFGVLHVSDDVMLFAKAAVGTLGQVPPVSPGHVNATAHILDHSCRWYEFEAVWFETSQPRKTIRCKPVAVGRHRDFWGFNRGKHAVIEAAILATRLEFLPAEEVNRQFDSLSVIVEKTGGEDERSAMKLLRDRVASFEEELRQRSE